MKKKQEKLGLVDDMDYSHIDQAYAEQELQNAQPAVDNAMPGLQVNPYEPDVYTQVLDTHNQQTQGVVSNPHTVESFEDWEQKALREQRETLRSGRSRFNSPPTTSGIPDVEEGRKPTPEELAEMRRKESLEYLTKQLQALQVEASNLQLKLSRNSQIQRNIKDKIESISN